MKEVELKEKRGRKVKQYLHRDGTITAKVFCDDIHFMKNGIYEEIDNTLVKEKNYYVNKDNDYKVYFPRSTSDVLMRMEKDNYYLNIKLENCNDVEIDINKNKSKSKLRSSVTYKNILDNIDFKYDISPNKVKETIVLNSKDKLKEKINFIIDTNLELILKNKEVLAQKDNELIFKFEVPYMYDSNNLVNDSVIYNLIKKENSYELELILDIEWLKEERNYPVYIDPTFTNVDHNISICDTYIYPNDTGVIKGENGILKAGVERINGLDIINRTLIKFNLPEIGTGDEIIDAYLNLSGYLTSNMENRHKLVSVHRVTNDWDELTADWASMNDKFSSRIETLYDVCRSYYDEEQNVIFDNISTDGNITNLVKKWYTDVPNYGIMIKSVNEDYVDDNYAAFFSKDNPFGDFQPVLEINYKNQNGIEDYWDYNIQNFSQGDIYINTYNGNMVGVWCIGNSICNKFPVEIDLVYNTNDFILDKNSIFGKGYKLSIDRVIRELIINNENYLEYVDADGTVHYFYEDLEEEAYVDEDGLNLIARKENDEYMIIDMYQNTMRFIKYKNCWYLYTIQDVSQNIITISRDSDNKITNVIDGSGDEFNFIYGDNEITIIGPSYNTKLNYVNGFLHSIDSIEGSTLFEYNQKGLPSSIIDVTGLKFNYLYFEEKPYKISRIVECGIDGSVGNSLDIEYGNNVTKIITDNGKVTSITFNSNGNVISCNELETTNNLSNSLSMTELYGDELKNKNLKLNDSIPMKFTKNYLRNSSFEDPNDAVYFSSDGILQINRTEECCHSGQVSLVVYSTWHSQIFQQDVVVPKGKFYTFSGYFKSNLTENNIGFMYLDENGNEVHTYERIDASEDFRRYEISIYYPENATSDLNVRIVFEGEGFTYIDDVQLEEGKVATTYNMIENADFSLGFDYWNLEVINLDTYNELSGTSETNYIVGDYFKIVNLDAELDKKGLRVIMNPDIKTSLKRTFVVNGREGDKYQISFWYKNNGIYTNGDFSSNSVSMKFINKDSNENEETTIW